jgi:hypothetical protein
MSKYIKALKFKTFDSLQLQFKLLETILHELEILVILPNILQL